MEKKRAIIIAVALFLFIGLGTFVFIKSFKNDNEDIKEPQTEIKENENDVTSEEDEKDSSKEEEGEKGFSSSNSSNSDIAEIDKEYADALIAVSKAEETITQEDIDAAKALIGNLTNEKNKEALLEKLNSIQNILDIRNQVKELTNMVDTANSIESIKLARDYVETNGLSAKINALTNEQIKLELTNELNKINFVLNDTTAPTITGIEDESITNKEANVIVSDETFVKIYLNGEEVKIESLKNLKETGNYTLEAVDQAFNKTIINFIIDLEVPKFNLESTTITNKNVEVIINDLALHYVEIYNKNTDTVKIETSNNLVLSDEAEYEISAVDKLGQKSVISVIIDKTAPNAEISYNITDLTNENVIATLINATEEITVVNNEGSLSYIFEENGNFVFNVSDKAGNITEIPAAVNNIDKILAEIEIGGIAEEKYVYQGQDFEVKITEENIDSVYYVWTTSEDIEEGKIALGTEEAIKVEETDLIKNEDGTYTFKVSEWEKQGKAYYFNVLVTDTVGNLSYAIKGPFNFDASAPTGKIEYDITTPTNDNVIATLNPSEEIIVLNNEGSLSYEFEENGIFVFEIKDADGNISTIEAKVNNIDRIAPILDTELDLRDKYLLTITSNEEISTINGLTKKESGLYQVSFTELPTTYEVADLAGNKTIIPIVTSYNEYRDTEVINERDVYLEYTFNEKVVIEDTEWLVNDEGLNAKKVFKDNGETSLVVKDEEGNATTIIYNITKVDDIAPLAEITINVRNGYEISFKASEEINDVEGFTKNIDGTYSKIFTEMPTTLEIMDLYGNVTILPIITKISEYKSPYKSENRDVYIDMDFNKEVTLDDVNWIPYSETITTKNWFVENGDREVVAIDSEGNKLTILYSITKVDIISPVVTGVEEGMSYENVIIDATDDNTNKEDIKATIDDISYTLGTEYNEVGEHVLKVIDTSGNISTVNFTITETILINN